MYETHNTIYGRHNVRISGKKRVQARTVSIIKYVLLSILGVVLFCFASRQAYLERGYKAVGGEYFLLLLPLIYYLVSRVVKDWINDISN